MTVYTNSLQQMQLETQQTAAEAEATAKKASEDVERLRRERDEAHREVQRLRKALKKKDQECQDSSEEVIKTRQVELNLPTCLFLHFCSACLDVLFFFQETQALLNESRSLQNRIHLASQAQEASKNQEQDYEEVQTQLFQCPQAKLSFYLLSEVLKSYSKGFLLSQVIKLLENEVAELKLKNSQKTPDPVSSDLLSAPQNRKVTAAHFNEQA